jgi:maltose O-acetyltransferase
MTFQPQIRDSSRLVALRQGLSLKRIMYLYIFYSIANYLPEPPLPGGNISMRIREYLVRRIFKKCGTDIKIHGRVHFGSGYKIEIGNYSSLNIGAYISNDTIIGENVMMGPGVTILSSSHATARTDVPMREQGMNPSKPVVIEDDVWIGTKSVILPGVRIGAHSIVGAGSIVTKPVPQFCVVAGNPARLIRYRNE